MKKLFFISLLLTSIAGFCQTKKVQPIDRIIGTEPFNKSYIYNGKTEKWEEVKGFQTGSLFYDSNKKLYELVIDKPYSKTMFQVKTKVPFYEFSIFYLTEVKTSKLVKMFHLDKELIMDYGVDPKTGYPIMGKFYYWKN